MTERIAKPEHIAVAPGEPPIVDVQGLWTQFGKGDETFTVHQDLNFTVQRGEMLSLVGGSGTGKTVLLRQILGLARPTRGQVTVLGKGGKTRAVLLQPGLWRELVALRGDAPDGAPVFRSRRGGHLTPKAVHEAVKAAGRRAGLPAGVSAHWLRHAHASHALDRGAPIHLVQATLGHVSVATTGKYLHARPNDSSGRYLAG